MKTEYLVWTSAHHFEIYYDEASARKYKKRVKAGDIEKITVTPGGLIVDSEILDRVKK